MIILNFAHPLTEEQLRQIAERLIERIEEVRPIPVRIDETKELVPQVVAIANQANLTAEEWQTLPILINPPGYSPVATALLAELHGRMGHFPSVIRLRPRHHGATDYEVAEIVNLQGLRDQARMRRLANQHTDCQ
ncbi:CRISPR-associated protein Csx15 [Thermogemmatispora carboxidivorans]|uniref:CRISPR-associated protein Csx15 n=1 Tax=Thermogemmatispora carboxidivorans TaxID=1382306 RepID=UPI00069A2927|nr:CRISPR-associated protein Csx15 [Thermogemmatispora carboxidivorans]